MRMNEKKNIILTNMDVELWKKFKGVCYTNGESMNQVVSQLITRYIADNS
jgi:adenylyl- and sulfurtransferase ThiI